MVPEGVDLAAGVHLTGGCHKARGGLVRAQLLERQGAIDDLELSGDFDCRPTHGLAALAARLRGVLLDGSELGEAVTRGMTELGIETAGVTAEDVAATITVSRHREP